MEKKKLTPLELKERDDRIQKKLALMRRKDLIEECLKRGMPFEDIPKASNPTLANFYYKNFEEEVFGDSILHDYDDWMEDELQKRGHKKGDAILSPSFRLGFAPSEDFKPQLHSFGVKTGRISASTSNISEKPRELPKPKRERDEDTGIMKGTKKALTYELQKKGKSLETTIKLVLKKFPDAKEKSIRIWYKRSENE